MNFLPILKNNKFILIVVLTLTAFLGYNKNKIKILHAQESFIESTNSEVELNTLANQTEQPEVFIEPSQVQSIENTPAEEDSVNEVVQYETDQINTGNPVVQSIETDTQTPAQEVPQIEIIEEAQEEMIIEQTKEFIPNGLKKKKPAPVKILNGENNQKNIKVNLDKNSKNFCSFSQFKINIKNTNYAEATININSDSPNNYLTIGNTPAGFNIKIKNNNKSEYAFGANKTTVISISKSPNSQKGVFTVPFILSSGDQEVRSDTICQITLEN
ncbi:MAG: hypothetical protein R3B55_01785 [Candidatus Paceibacterota bacterium]